MSYRPSGGVTCLTKEKVRVKHLGVWSVALFFAVLSALYGLVAGILGVIAIVPTFDLGIISAIGASIGGIIVSMIIWAIGGFVGGAIAAIVYNLVFAVQGGIEVDLDVESIGGRP
jgi:hypothetical protein